VPPSDALAAGFADGALRAWDCSDDAATRGREAWRADGDGEAVTALRPLNARGGACLAVGDDDGRVRLWDARLRGDRRPPVESQPHEDYVSDIAVEGTTLLTTGADGRLAALDARSNLKPLGVSEPQDDELLAVAVLKGGRKVICGTATGPLVVYNWGRWGDSKDRLLGHPESVDALLRFDDDTLVTGSSDGRVRVCRVMPGLDVLGVLGEHDGFPVEALAFNADRSSVLSLSHDSVVRVFDASGLEEMAAAGGDSDDSDGSEGSNSDSDSDAPKKKPAAKRRKAAPKAENAFFEGL